MKIIFNGQLLGKAIKTKRIIDLDWDIRKAADNIGISSATLSRIENGKMPDLLTYAKVCKWVGVEMGACIKVEHPKKKR